MSWIQTYTGKKFTPLNPRIEDIDILDIAHALSNQCRFSGHVREFYSVGQHSVLISEYVPPADALWGLLHDSAEAYLVDLPRPIKQQMPTYRAYEQTLMAVILSKFSLSADMPESVAEADHRIFLDERNALMAPPPEDWKLEGVPLGVEIVAWKPAYAKHRFLRAFHQLTKVAA